jgi:hypothetical protein
MRFYIKVLGSVIAVVLVAAVALLLFNGGAPEHTDPRVNVDLTAAVRVLDLVNNTPVPGSPVYFVACCPDNTSLRDVHLNGQTGDDGLAVFSVNYTLDQNKTIYLGASNRKPLVESDFSSKNFNGSGYLGEWKSFDYSMLYNSEDNNATINCIVIVNLDTGKMI